MINVTRSFMPPIEEYQQYIKKIWDSKCLTNDGPLLKELQIHLQEFLRG